MPATPGTGQTKDTPAAAVSTLESHLELPAPAWLNNPTEPTSTLTVFSLVPLPWRVRVGEVDLQPGVGLDPLVVEHLVALVARQRAPQLSGDCAERAD
jgi:hypothetical protein